jgi:hypothetical protein
MSAEHGPVVVGSVGVCSPGGDIHPMTNSGQPKALKVTGPELSVIDLLAVKEIWRHRLTQHSNKTKKDRKEEDHESIKK